ncbi:PepSY domain-containing protein [Streptomyces sp. NPDC058867]|uniref:PepSY domain-containing protein n=1 Tax=unclassified Streptomyces TaxID=2593676 RepID=UPI0036CA2018
MKRKLVIATVTAAVLAGGGTVVAYASGDDDAPARDTSNTRVTDGRDDDGRDDDAVAAGGARVTAADAVAAALAHTPGTAVSVDLEDDGADAWEVDVVPSDAVEHTVRVSAETGKVLGDRRDDDDSGREDLAALKGTSVDAQEAARAAAAKGTVTDLELDDDGPAAWKVETTRGEWRVDLKTGEVTRVQDDTDDRDDDADADDRGDQDDRDDD